MNLEEKVEMGIIVVISVIAALLVVQIWRDVLAALIVSLFSFMGCVGVLAFRQQLRKTVVIISAASFLFLGLVSLILALVNQLF